MIKKRKAKDIALLEPKVLKWSDQLAEELHKPVVRRFCKRRVIISGIYEVWAVDLVDMQAYAEYNDVKKYFLCVIDLFSKYGWIVPLKDKSGKSFGVAFRRIFFEGNLKNCGLIKEHNFTIKMLKHWESSCIQQRMRKIFHG